MTPIVFKTIEDVPSQAVSLGSIEVNKTGSWRTVRPVYKNNIPPCSVGCPAGERIPEYFALVEKGEFEKAWRMILEDNPLPGVCGRVCYHPCESKCNRAEFDEPIAIHAMERYVADLNFDNIEPMPMLESKKDKRVAIIGSGPAGLSCAWQLARRGYDVTMFEALPQPGGMLRVGIPSYRLPRVVLDKEIADILRLGVELKCSTQFGVDFDWDDLEEFEAIFVAVGAHGSKALGIDGEQCDEIRAGIGMLREVSEGIVPQMGKRVVVIGGGNTAIDVARTALRMGREATIVYRRSRREMPAVPEEIEEAINEGVVIQYLSAPARIVRRGEKLLGIECTKMELGEPDASGRRRPVAVSGSEFIVEADTIYTAIGENPQIQPFRGMLVDEQGRLKVDGKQRTSQAFIFAGGDAATNPLGTVVDGIHSGKYAAFAIHEFLSGALTAEREGKIVSAKEILSYYFKREPRPGVPRISVDDAVKSFTEVNESLDHITAHTEAQRCYSCGVCNSCDNCLSFCPDVAIHRNGNGTYVIDLEHCKGCAICVEECPRSAMVIEQEMK